MVTSIVMNGEKTKLCDNFIVVATVKKPLETLVTELTNKKYRT